MQRLHGLPEARRAFATRTQRYDAADRAAVEAILDAVRERGDAAVKQYTARFDHVETDELVVADAEFERAYDAVDAGLLDALRVSIRRLGEFFGDQPRGGFLRADGGSLVGQIVRPLDRVGLYVPGGTSPLVSTVVHLAVPARVAGVPDLVVATPPRPDGSVTPEVLVAARELGVGTVYRMGGAQAVAALAYGTETVRRVDLVAGPGNRYVVLAKALLYGVVGIEALPGPTETLVLADAHADPRHVAADLLAQAEHLDAQPVLVTTSAELAADVLAELERQLADLPTAAAARESLGERGYLVLVDDVAEGVEVANLYAPEHLCVLVRDPWSVVPHVRNAGGLFLGETSMEALGDYTAGPSHVMPTGGSARFASAVNVRDFQKVIPIVATNEATVRAAGPAAVRLARAEGLEAHARAILSRLEPGDRA